jgi:hypothetical protein
LEIASEPSSPGLDEEMEVDSDDWDSSDSSSPFHTGTRGTMAAQNTPLGLGWDHITNQPLIAPTQNQIPQEIPPSIGFAGGYHDGRNGFGMNPQFTGAFNQGHGTPSFQGNGTQGSFYPFFPVLPTFQPPA